MKLIRILLDCYRALPQVDRLVLAMYRSHGGKAVCPWLRQAFEVTSDAENGEGVAVFLNPFRYPILSDR